jgi:integrase
MATKRSTFGSIRKLPSGNIQARFTGPDGEKHLAPRTFLTRGDADAWLAQVRSDISRGTWSAAPPRIRPTVTEYASQWIYSRTTKSGEPLRPRTRSGYERILRLHLLPDPIGDLTLDAVTVADVEAWWSRLSADTPTWRAHCYRLLRAVMNGAVEADIIEASPCRKRGAGTVKRKVEIEPATPAELAVITEHMPERLRLAVSLSAWCALRFGEIAELRGSDIDLRSGVVKVRRAMVRVDGKTIVGKPKSQAGVRDVHIPPHLVPEVKTHLWSYVTGRDGLIFPGADGVSQIHLSTLRKHFRRACAAAGRPDLRWHDLRHTGAVMAAQAGATMADLMARLGHSSADAALRYQHTARGRDAMLAARLSELASQTGASSR